MFGVLRNDGPYFVRPVSHYRYPYGVSFPPLSKRKCIVIIMSLFMIDGARMQGSASLYEAPDFVASCDVASCHVKSCHGMAQFCLRSKTQSLRRCMFGVFDCHASWSSEETN